MKHLNQNDKKKNKDRDRNMKAARSEKEIKYNRASLRFIANLPKKTLQI